MTYYVEANDNGCISQRIAIPVEVHSNDSSTYYVTACNFYLSPDLQLYATKSGAYVIRYTDQYFCDSIVTYNVTINKADTSVNRIGNSLSSNANPASYQWIDCNSGTILFGDTNQILTPTINGNYAVIVEQNDCIDTSSCYVMNHVDIESLDQLVNVRIYPNPTSGKLNIDLGQIKSEIHIELSNGEGQVIKSWKFEKINHVELEMPEYRGLYFLKMSTEDNQRTFKVLKD